MIGMAHDVGRAADVLVDDGDADAGADDDGLAGDRVGRADRGDHARGHGLQGGVIEAAGGDDGEFVAAEAGDQVVAAQGAAQPLGDAADQLVADRVAERVVDVLEMVEIDVEDGRGRPPWRTFSMIASSRSPKNMRLGKPAERIVHGEVPQPRFAGGDGRGRAAHIAEHQAGQQRKSGERDRDERQTLWTISAPGCFGVHANGATDAPCVIGQIEDVVAGGDGFRLDLAQVAQLQTRGDVRQHVFVDELDAQTTGAAASVSGEASSGAVTATRGDDGRAAEKCLQAHGAVQAGILGGSATAGVGCRRGPRTRSRTAVTSGWIQLNQFGSTLRCPSEA